jgi:hypothetical protein
MAKKLRGRTASCGPSQLPSRRPARHTVTARGAFLGAVMLLLIGGCAQETAKAPLPVTPPEDRANAPVIRRPLPETPVPPPEASPGVLVPAPAPAIVLPPKAQYVCVTEAAGQRQQTVIEFSPKVAGLCLKHPEMGPCQYERNACRKSGGRVFAAEGKEITMGTEAEYDRKVIRIRLKSN